MRLWAGHLVHYVLEYIPISCVLLRCPPLCHPRAHCRPGACGHWFPSLLLLPRHLTEISIGSFGMVTVDAFGEANEIHRNTVPTHENGGNLTSNRTSFLYENRGNSPRYLYQRRAIVSSKNKKCIILVTRWLRNCITVVSIYSSFPMFQTSISIPILCFPPAIISYPCVSPIPTIPTFLKSYVPKEPLGPLS